MQYEHYQVSESDTRVEMQALQSGSRRTGMSDDEEHEVDHTTALDARTRLKLDCILLPFLSLLFCLNHLDKTNIGNAETGGFSRDAGLDQGDINTAMAWFFAFFVALQPLGAAIGRKVGMVRWVPSCMSLWGICTILHIWVRSRWQLVLLRITIAVLEAGFYSTTVSYLSLFYTRYEFATRLGFFYGQAAFAGALGGILSWVVYSRREAATHGIKSWQVLFLVEGCITLVVATAGFLWLPHCAGDAWFLTQAERRWAEQRIVADQREASHLDATHDTSQDEQHEDDENPDKGDDVLEPEQRLLESNDLEPRTSQPLTADSGLQKYEITSAFFQYRIWHLLLCNILSAIPATAFGIFLPLVVQQMQPDLHLSPAASNLLAVPPFAFGAAVLLGFTYWSDRRRQRLYPILLGLIILLLGLTITVAAPRDNIGLRYTGLCILLSGSYIASPLAVAWISNNTPEPGKRAILLGINGWGNLAGVSSGVLFTPADAENGYTFSFGVTLVCVAVAFVGYFFFILWIRRINSTRDLRTEAWTARQRRREALFGDVSTFRLTSKALRRGDDRLTYRYTF